MEESKNIKIKEDIFTKLRLTVIYGKFGLAKEYLDKQNELKFSYILRHKPLNGENVKEIESSQVKLIENQMDFYSNDIKFNQINPETDKILIIMCISDAKYKKKFEANSIDLKRLVMNKETELKIDLFKDSYIKLIYCMELCKNSDDSRTFHSKHHSLNSADNNQILYSNKLNNLTQNENNIKSKLNIFEKNKNENYIKENINKSVIHIKKESLMDSEKNKDLIRNLQSLMDNKNLNAKGTKSDLKEEICQPENYKNEKVKSFGSSPNFQGRKLIEYTHFTDKNVNISEETFCEAFTFTGAGLKNPKILYNTDIFKSFCGHEKCSTFDAYKPEILYRYPLKDTKKLEINSLGASLCFTNGIKFCMQTDQQFTTTITDFYTFLTHQDGTRYYMFNHFFFLKIEKSEFEKKFHMGPLKSFMKLEQVGTEKFLLDPQAETKIKNQLDICESLINDDFFIIPFCASLISKFPYVEQMHICLDKFVKMYFNHNIKEQDIYYYLQYLIKSIVVPSPDKMLQFYIPYNKFPLKLPGITIEDLPCVNNNFWKIMKFLSKENIIMIFYLMIMEQKILFVAEKHKHLSEIIDCFVNMIYPFQWVHTCIPVLAEELIKYLQSFLPFIMGIDETMLPLAEEYLKEEQDIYIINITKDSINTSNELKNLTKKKRNSNADLLKNLPQLPEYIESILNFELEKIKKKFNNSIEEGLVNTREIEKKIRNLFCLLMIQLLDGYNKFLTIIDEVPNFDSEGFLKYKGGNEEFFEEFSQTQIFRQFLQNSPEEIYPFYKNLQEKMKKENKINIFSNEYYLNQNLSHLNKRRSSSNQNRNLSRLNSLYLVDGNNEKFSELTKINKKKLNNKVKIVDDYETVFEFKENFILYPYYLDYDSKHKIDLKSKSECLMNFDAFNKYLSNQSLEEELKIIQSENGKKGDKENMNFLSMENRLFENFRSLEMEKIPESFFRYSLMDNYFTNIYNKNNKKQNYTFNLKSIILEIGKKKGFDNDKLHKSKSINNCENVDLLNYQESIKQVKRKITLHVNEETGDEATDYLIEEYLKKLMLDQEVKEDRDIQLICCTISGRKNLAKFLVNYYPSNNKQENNNQNITLIQNNFEILANLISSSLVSIHQNMENINFENTQILTSILFKFYMVKLSNNQKSNFFLYERISQKKGIFIIWKNFLFWDYYFNQEIKEIKKESPNEDDYFRLIWKLSHIMLNLKFDYKLLTKVSIEYLAKSYLKNERYITKLIDLLKNYISFDSLKICKTI